MKPARKASRFWRRPSRSSWPETIIQVVIPAICLFLPGLFINLSWQGANLDRLYLLALLVIVGLAAWLAKVLSAGSLSWRWRRFDWLAIASLLAVSLATIWSPVWRNSLFGGYGQPMRSLVFFWLLFFLYLLVVNNWSAKLRQWCWLATLVSFSLIAIYSVCQLFGLFIIPLAFTKTIGFNPIGSLSNLSLFLAAALPLFLLAVDHSDDFIPAPSHKTRLVWNIWLGLAAVAALVALAALGSFTIWPIVILGLLIVLIFGLSRLIKLTRCQLIATVGALAISFVLLVLGNFGWLKLALPSEVSLSRGFSWQIAKSSLAHHPVLGTGLASFNSAFSRFKTADFNAAALWNLDFDLPAGWLLESLVVVGGLGTLLLLAGLIWGLIIAWRRLLAVKTDLESEDVNFGAGLLAAIMVLLLGGALLPVGNSLLFIFGLLWVLLMVITYQRLRRVPAWSWQQSGQHSSAIWTAGVIVVAIALLSSLTYLGKIYLADIIAGRAVNNSSTDQQISGVAAAQRLAPWREMYGFSLAQLSWVKANQVAEAAAGATSTEALEAQNQAKAYAQQAKQLLDQNAKLIQNQPAGLKTLAALYEMIGDFDGSMTTQQRLIAIDPNNPWPQAKLAQLKVAMAYQASTKEDKDKLVEEALSGYQRALALKPGWAEAYFYRANLYQAIQKFSEATDDLVQAVNYSNGSADYQLALAQLLNERAKIETDKSADFRLQAEQLAKSILASNSDNINALYVLAIIYRDGGQTDSARQTVQDLLSKAQDNDKSIIQQQFADLLP